LRRSQTTNELSIKIGKNQPAAGIDRGRSRCPGFEASEGSSLRMKN
jgi:hypothetical protein